MTGESQRRNIQALTPKGKIKKAQGGHVANPDGITDDVRKREEEYFRRRDKELIERMRKAAESEQARRNLENASGLHDAVLLQDLEELGFTPDTLSLLPLIPVLQVAWAEAGVSNAERRLIIDLARSRGITQGSAADQQLTEWLERPPSGDTFRKAGRLIAAMLDEPAGSMKASADDLLAYCEQIAAASGGILGIGKVSAEERAALEQIAAQLKQR
jgi:hypothetical protein